MGLYTATTQNVILMAKGQNIDKVVSQIEGSETGKKLAEELGIFISDISIADAQESALLISATKPSYDHIYADEVFEFTIPQSIENEVLENKAITFLDSFPEFIALDGDYKLTRAGIRTTVIS